MGAGARRRAGARGSGRRAETAVNGSILYVERLTVDFDGFKALSELNFIMDEGELRVVIGPNGAGKTTLLDVISGKVQPTSGRVVFGRGTDLSGPSGHEIARIGVGRKFQTPTGYGGLSVRENLELSLRRDKGVFATFVARLSPSQRDEIDLDPPPNRLAG